jgi:transcriptional regulator with XRE-family HTH domain
MSLSELGERAGIDRSAIARAERKGYDPRASTLNAIAKALEIPVCELFEDSGHRQAKRKKT